MTYVSSLGHCDIRLSHQANLIGYPPPIHAQPHLDKRTCLDNIRRMTNTLPRLTRQRHDGWSPEVQQQFLDELSFTASPSLAAAAVGRSVRSAHRLRARPDAGAFRDGWTAAMATCMTQMREQALDRAFNGHIAPIIKNGRKVGERPVIRDVMLMCLLRLYDAPVFHADRAREAVVAAAPKLLTRAELIVEFEAALVKVRQARIERGLDNVDETASE